MRALFYCFAVLLLASLAAGCDRAEPAECNTGGSSNQDVGLICGEPYDLTEADGPGWFGIKAVAFVHVSVAGIIETDTETTLLGLGVIEYDPATLELTFTNKICQIEIPQVDVPGQSDPTGFEVLPQLLPNIDPLLIQGTTTGNETCAEINTDRAVAVIGARLDDPMFGELPTDPATQTCDASATSNCIFDVDQDGKPGATLLAFNTPGVQITEAYAILRTTMVLTGFIGTDDLLTGTADIGLEQEILGCRLIPGGGGFDRECNASELGIVRAINPVITPSEDIPSTFLAVRIPPDATCEWLIDEQDNVFGR